jgi:hypothetical protein
MNAVALQNRPRRALQKSPKSDRAKKPATNPRRKNLHPPAEGAPARSPLQKARRKNLNETPFLSVKQTIVPPFGAELTARLLRLLPDCISARSALGQRMAHWPGVPPVPEADNLPWRGCGFEADGKIARRSYAVGLVA